MIVVAVLQKKNWKMTGGRESRAMMAQVLIIIQILAVIQRYSEKPVVQTNLAGVDIVVCQEEIMEMPL
jgi:hypothetical protein